MISPLIRVSACAAALLCGSSAVAAADLDVYREFRLGSPTATVIARAGAMGRDLKTQHQRPALLQELSWRPPYVANGMLSGRDSVRSVLFSFLNDRLFKITVEYETRQTEGMTPADMIASLTAVYGPVVPLAAPAARRAALNKVDAAVPVARWHKGDTDVVLQHSVYGRSFSLIIALVSVDQQARKAQVDAQALDVREGPARDAAEAKARADAASKAAEATRATNKAAFKP